MGLVLVGMNSAFDPTFALLLAEVVVGIVVYGVLLIVVRGVRPEERRFVAEVAQRGWKRLSG